MAADGSQPWIWVSYLRHVVTEEGLAADPEKVEQVHTPTTYTSLYLYVLSTFLRTSNFTLYTRSRFRLVEHSTTIRNGKIQHQLLNQEYSSTITQRLPSSTHRLIEKTEQFLRRMHWKDHFFLNPDTTPSSKETYGFKSTKKPPPVEELKDFEDDMLKMIQTIKFKQVNNPFLHKLKEDTDQFKNEPKLLIATEKTTNFYKLEPCTYNDLIEKKHHKILQESPTGDDTSNT